MRRAGWAALTAAGTLALARGVGAQPPAETLPDLEFLEYLGSWQADDDEWLAVREWERDNPPNGQAEGERPATPEPEERAPRTREPDRSKEDDHDPSN
jgi:hypothetical protein